MIVKVSTETTVYGIRALGVINELIETGSVDVAYSTMNSGWLVRFNGTAFTREMSEFPTEKEMLKDIYGTDTAIKLLTNYGGTGLFTDHVYFVIYADIPEVNVVRVSKE